MCLKSNSLCLFYSFVLIVSLFDSVLCYALDNKVRSFEGELNFGLIVYQDVQVPASSDLYRGDGSAVGPENTLHIGVPVSLKLSKGIEVVPNLLLIAGVGMLNSSGQSGDKETINAGYGRWDAELGLKAYRNNFWYKSDLILRRETYKNVSSVHIARSILLSGRAGIRFSRRWGGQVLGQYALSGDFLFDRAGDAFGGGRLPSAKVSVVNLGMTVERHLTRTSIFQFGFETSEVGVNIGNIFDYSRFGLAVDRLMQPTRRLDLTTQWLQIGFMKRI